MNNSYDNFFLFVLQNVFKKGYDAKFVAKFLKVSVHEVLSWCSLSSCPSPYILPIFSSMLRLRSKNWYAVYDKFKGEI